MAVGCVQHNGIGADGYQLLHAIQAVGVDAHCSCHQKAAFAILAGLGVILDFGDILVGDKTHQLAVLVHHGELLHLGLHQDFGGCGNVGVWTGGYQILLCHHLAYQAAVVVLEAEVTVGDNTHQKTAIVHHGDAADMVCGHQLQGIGHCLVALDGHRVVYHTVFRTLYSAHLVGLHVYRHILVDNADAASTRHCNGHLILGDGIHRRRNNGDAERDFAGKHRGNIHVARNNLAARRYQQNIVEGQAFHHNFVGEILHN